jgi:hypothetical protein
MNFGRSSAFAFSRSSCTEKNSMRASSPSRAGLLLGVFALAGLLLPPAHAQKDLEKLQAKFDRETNPVKKAKNLQKLGEAEFEALRDAILSGNIQVAGDLAERYRDQARAAHNGLAATGMNAVKKPGGFQQLQISVRESIFKLRDLIPVLPLAERAPFLAVQHDLEALNRKLLGELFPHPAKGRKDQRR